MPHKPTITQGAVSTRFNVDELAETGVLTRSVGFSLTSNVQKTKAHVSATKLNQVVRTRMDIESLMIAFEGEAIPDGNGKLSGLAAVYAGQNLAVCAHFAADVVESGEVTVEGQTIFGFKRDAAKLLQINEPTLDLSPEDPANIKFNAEYLPEIDHDATAA